MQAFKATYGGDCDSRAPDADPAAADTEVNVLKYHYDYETKTDPEHEAKLFKFECSAGAYNAAEVYYLADEQGFRQLQFAEPELDIRYEDPDDQTKLKSMTIIGYTASDQIENSEYDENDRSLTSF